MRAVTVWRLELNYQGSIRTERSRGKCFRLPADKWGPLYLWFADYGLLALVASATVLSDARSSSGFPHMVRYIRRMRPIRTRPQPNSIASVIPLLAITPID